MQRNTIVVLFRVVGAVAVWVNKRGNTGRRPLLLLLGGLADSDLSIEEAAPILREQVELDPSAAVEVGKNLAAAQMVANSYELDRRARILAAARGLPCEWVVGDDERELFAREYALGSRSLREAFDEIVELVPELGYLRVDADPGSSSTQRTADSVGEESQKLRRLVGPDSSHPDPLVRTALVRTITNRHRWVFRGRQPRSSLDERLYGRPFDWAKLDAFRKEQRSRRAPRSTTASQRPPERP